MRLPNQSAAVIRASDVNALSGSYLATCGIAPSQACQSCLDGCATLASGWRRLACSLRCRTTVCAIPQSN
jgi:hypothetical protein